VGHQHPASPRPANSHDRPRRQRDFPSFPYSSDRSDRSQCRMQDSDVELESGYLPSTGTHISCSQYGILRAPRGQSKERLSPGSPPIPGLLLAGSPSSGGDVYIVRPFWERPFKLLVYDHRVDTARIYARRSFTFPQP